MGASMSVTDDLIVIGDAVVQNVATAGGRAFAYDRSTYTRLFEMVNPVNPTPNTKFGLEVYADETHIAVSDWVGVGSTDLGFPVRSGIVHVYSAIDGSFIRTLQPDIPPFEPTVTYDSSRYGFDTVVSGGRLVAGAPQLGNSAGAFFVHDIATGAQLARVDSPSPSGGRFGRAIAANDNYIVVGAPRSDVNGVIQAGQVHIFDASTFNLIASVNEPTPRGSSNFGGAIDLHAGLIAIANGDPREETSGSTNDPNVHLFEAATGTFIATVSTPSSDGLWGVPKLTDGYLAIARSRSNFPSFPLSPDVYLFAVGARGAVYLGGFIQESYSGAFSSVRYGREFDLAGNQLYAVGGQQTNSSNPGTVFPNIFTYDCDNNGLDDAAEIASDPTLDRDQNGELDSCQIIVNPSLDCNGNGYVDSAEIEDGVALDCNENGVPDDCDILTLTQVEAVVIMDTSGSMGDEAQLLCQSLDDVESQLLQQGIVASITVWGIDSTPSGSFSCLTSNVVDELGLVIPGDPALGGGSSISGNEDWGSAACVVAERFPWDERFRVIIPISDEGPRVGGTIVEGTCDDDPLAGPDALIIQNLIDIANDNLVRVSPIIGTGADACVIGLAQDVASATSGVSSRSTDNGRDFSVTLLQAIQGATNSDDDNNNGIPDECDCAADLNGDGSVTPADFNAWIMLYNMNDPAADFNGDGQVTPADFNAWILAYNSNQCPN